jgi:hypothetical protein
MASKDWRWACRSFCSFCICSFIAAVWALVFFLVDAGGGLVTEGGAESAMVERGAIGATGVTKRGGVLSCVVRAGPLGAGVPRAVFLCCRGMLGLFCCLGSCGCKAAKSYCVVDIIRFECSLEPSWRGARALMWQRGRLGSAWVRLGEAEMRRRRV